MREDPFLRRTNRGMRVKSILKYRAAARLTFSKLPMQATMKWRATNCTSTGRIHTRQKY